MVGICEGPRQIKSLRRPWRRRLTQHKDGVKNSKLCRLPLQALPDVQPDTWEEVWLPGEFIKLESFGCFQNFMVVEGREKGEPRIFIHNYGEGDATQPPVHRIDFPDAAAHSGRVLTPRGAMAARAVFSVGLTGNNIFATDMLWSPLCERERRKRPPDIDPKVKGAWTP